MTVCFNFGRLLNGYVNYVFPALADDEEDESEVIAPQEVRKELPGKFKFVFTILILTILVSLLVLSVFGLNNKSRLTIDSSFVHALDEIYTPSETGYRKIIRALEEDYNRKSSGFYVTILRYYKKVKHSSLNIDLNNTDDIVSLKKINTPFDLSSWIQFGLIPALGSGINKYNKLISNAVFLSVSNSKQQVFHYNVNAKLLNRYGYIHHSDVIKTVFKKRKVVKKKVEVNKDDKDAPPPDDRVTECGKIDVNGSIVEEDDEESNELDFEHQPHLDLEYPYDKTNQCNYQIIHGDGISGLLKSLMQGSVYLSKFPYFPLNSIISDMDTKKVEIRAFLNNEVDGTLTLMELSWDTTSLSTPYTFNTISINGRDRLSILYYSLIVVSLVTFAYSVYAYEYSSKYLIAIDVLMKTSLCASILTYRTVFRKLRVNRGGVVMYGREKVTYELLYRKFALIRAGILKSLEMAKFYNIISFITVGILVIYLFFVLNDNFCNILKQLIFHSKLSLFTLGLLLSLYFIDDYYETDLKVYIIFLIIWYSIIVLVSLLSNRSDDSLELDLKSLSHDFDDYRLLKFKSIYDRITSRIITKKQILFIRKLARDSNEPNKGTLFNSLGDVISHTQGDHTSLKFSDTTSEVGLPNSSTIGGTSEVDGGSICKGIVVQSAFLGRDYEMRKPRYIGLHYIYFIFRYVLYFSLIGVLTLDCYCNYYNEDVSTIVKMTNSVYVDHYDWDYPFVYYSKMGHRQYEGYNAYKNISTFMITGNLSTKIRRRLDINNLQYYPRNTELQLMNDDRRIPVSARFYDRPSIRSIWVTEIDLIKNPKGTRARIDHMLKGEKGEAGTLSTKELSDILRISMIKKLCFYIFLDANSMIRIRFKISSIGSLKEEVDAYPLYSGAYQLAVFSIVFFLLLWLVYKDIKRFIYEYRFYRNSEDMVDIICIYFLNDLNRIFDVVAIILSFASIAVYLTLCITYSYFNKSIIAINTILYSYKALWMINLLLLLSTFILKLVKGDLFLILNIVYRLPILYTTLGTFAALNVYFKRYDLKILNIIALYNIWSLWPKGNNKQTQLDSFESNSPVEDFEITNLSDEQLDTVKKETKLNVTQETLEFYQKIKEINEEFKGKSRLRYMESLHENLANEMSEMLLLSKRLELRLGIISKEVEIRSNTSSKQLEERISILEETLNNKRDELETTFSTFRLKMKREDM